MRVSLVLLFAYTLGFSLAVKEYLFRTCSQSGFCARNRHYASQVSEDSDFLSPYSIDPNSVQIDNSNNIVHATILKSVPSLTSPIGFSLEISGIGKDSVRVKIDEDRSHVPAFEFINSRRYDETSKWSFASKQVPKISDYSISVVKNDYIEFKYGSSSNYVTRIFFTPFKVVLFKDGVVQLTANADNFMNIEHWRQKDDNEANLLSQESSYDMFEDSFKDASDGTVSLGPESVAMDFEFSGYQHVYGIPEHADSLDLKNTKGLISPYRLYNVDIFEYECDSKLPMYGAIPFLRSSRADASVGIFWVNSAETYIEIDKITSKKDTKAHWMSENGVLDFVLFVGEKPNDIDYSYGLVTGYTALPQLASLGYHQCRWNYNSEEDVLLVSRLFDEFRIPYDYIWLDVEYAESKKYFTWNKDMFPTPNNMMKELDYTGRGLIVIVDPHLKKDYFVSDYVTSHQITMNDRSNNTYYGHCWPGESVWIDTMNPSSQAYWDELFQLSTSNPLIGDALNAQLWNDMNEPSVFNGPETSAPKDNLHYGGWEHRSIHNVFGLTYHEATYSSLIKRLLGTEVERPFILTRSFFAGSQRTSAMWTGDNMSKWEYLKTSIPMVLTMGVLGMPFAGADIGGFFGNPLKQLLTRWYQTGVFYPFMRAHAHIDSRRREPWVPGEPYTSIIRDAITLRYSLLPIIYTAFYDASQTGLPVIKPLFYETPENPESYSIDDEFFIGDSGILVKPVTEEDAKTVKTYIPDNSRYYYFNEGIINGKYISKKGYYEEGVKLETIPMFLKGGSIVFKKERYRRSTRAMVDDPYHIIIGLDENESANGKLYIDDGATFEYLDGKFSILEIRASGLEISSKLNDEGSAINEKVVVEKISIVGGNFQDIKNVVIEQEGSKWHAVAEFLEKEQVLVIKNPRVSILKVWKIKPLKDSPFTDHDEL